jgi:hypothetical protein
MLLYEMSNESYGHNQSSNFYRLWLKDGGSLTPFQRIAFGFTSVVVLVLSLPFAQTSWGFFHEETIAEGGLFYGCFFGLVAAVFFFLGVAGIRNILKRRSDK